MRTYATERLRERGASVWTRTVVQHVESNDGLSAVRTDTERGTSTTLQAKGVLWATGTVGPSFLRDSGLSTDDHGFLHMTSQLRTLTHPRIFAAGDCATLLNANLDKVGVHAVKQGPDLRANLKRFGTFTTADPSLARTT